MVTFSPRKNNAIKQGPPELILCPLSFFILILGFMTLPAQCSRTESEPRWWWLAGGVRGWKALSNQADARSVILTTSEEKVVPAFRAFLSS